MTHIVKEKEYYIQFDRFVRDMSIVTTVERVSNIDNATEFDDENGARSLIKEAELNGYDISNYTIHDKDRENELIKENAEKEAREYIKKGWNNTSEEGKRKHLKHLLDDKGTDAVKEFLEYVEDTSGITPAEEETNPLLNTMYSNMEKILGRALTDEEKETLTEGM